MIRAVEMQRREKENAALRRLAEKPAGKKLSSDLLRETREASRRTVKRLFDSYQQNDFKEGVKVPEMFALYFTATPIEPTLEAIRLEMSVDQGKSWNIVASLNNHQPDGEYFYPWRLSQTFRGTPLQFRLVASDIWGRSQPIMGAVNFELEGKNEPKS
jgi:hypothetical protein